MRHSIKRASAIFAVCATVAACGGDSTSPTPSSTVAGSYTATEFVTTGGSGQRNELLAGSSLDLVLKSDGTTTGHLHVAASGSTPAFDADMAGTWAQTGNVITFSQSADTFVRNMNFTLDSNGSRWLLIGDQGFSGTRIQVTLTQSVSALATRSF
jgi:hypothetical protein